MQNYSYTLPEELIAKEPSDPRDTARLFVYNTVTDEICFDIFRNLAQYLPEKSLMVLNDTKVVPARLHLVKETGGKIEVFLLVNEMKDTDVHIVGIVDRKIEVGQKLYFPDENFLTVVRQDEQYFYFDPSFPIPKLGYYLEKYGETPVPKYLKGGQLTEQELRAKYQTIFGRKGASVAAPTASLHFTHEVFDSLKAKNINKVYTTLNVGMGTFAPITDANFEKKQLHNEWCEVSGDTVQAIEQAKKDGRKIVAVGTTATRALETASKSGHLQPYVGMTDIFIFPPYQFVTVDCLITNFHLPNTSLMYLVETLLEQKKAKRNITDLYKIAIENKFRFYSFGDSMLIV